MGTNYYAVRNRPSISEPIHIGKSSLGWLFNFQIQNQPWSDPPVVWRSFDEVCAWLNRYVKDKEEYVVMDEYDRIVPLEEFLKRIEDKQNDDLCRNNPDNFSYSTNVGGYRFTDGEFR